MNESIIVVRKDSHPNTVYKELAELSTQLANENLDYMGDAFKKKVSSLPTPLKDFYFKDEHVETICKMVEGKIVSFVSITHTVGMIGISYVYTLPEYRCQGHATDAFEKLFKMYNKETQYYYIIAYTKNAAALALYTKLGFVSNYVTMEL